MKKIEIENFVQRKTERGAMMFSKTVITYIIFDIISIGLRAILPALLRSQILVRPDIFLEMMSIIHLVPFIIKNILFFYMMREFRSQIGGEKEKDVTVEKQLDDMSDQKKRKKKFCQNCGIEREKGLLKCKSK